MNKLATALILCLSIWGGSTPLMAELQEMNNDQMNSISAQAGISIYLDNATFYDEYGSIQVCDSDNAGSLVLSDVVVDNGSGWGYSFTTLQPLTIDLVQYDAYTAVDGIYQEKNIALEIDAPAWQQNLKFTVNNLYFCGQPLGKLEVGPIRHAQFNFMLTTPDFDYGSLDSSFTTHEYGLYYRYKLQTKIDKVQFTYPAGALTLQDLRFANSFDNEYNNTYYFGNLPSQTTDSDVNGYFIIGRGEDPNSQFDFAHINLIRDGSTVKMDMTMPMEGSIRANSVQIGARACGPVAIDGIQVHSMSIQLIP